MSYLLSQKYDHMNTFHRTIFISLMACLAGYSKGQDLKATIKIDPDRKIGEVDKRLFGSFTEHLGRCIYGGIYDPKSSQADSFGFRKDVIAAGHASGLSVVRWPGGNFASGYHWLDGVGPRESRPVRQDLAWGDKESNQVGTDEFLQFAREIGAEPYICVNLGTGSWDEAKNWVEYCNAKTGLFFSDLRAKNGHQQPYAVKYWGLGNEIDGPWQMGHRSAEDYCKFALEAAKLMKWSDPAIQLIASGSSNYGADWTAWNRTVLTELRDHIDFISLHHYAGNYSKDHYQFMAATSRVEDIIKTTEAQVNEVHLKYKNRNPVYIAFDEYNVWYRAFNEQKLEEHYNLQDALVVAMYLNTFVRHANIVKMANMAQLVNVIAPMMVTKDRLWLQTIYFPLQLFSTRCKGQALDTYLHCETYDAGEFKQIPYLDISACYDSLDGSLMLSVVNRHLDRAIETTIINQRGNLDNRARLYEVNSSSITDENSVDEQKVKVATREMNVEGNHFVMRFPPHSFTMIQLQLKP
jgi:alpha-N-arabinofuranosidase